MATLEPLEQSTAAAAAPWPPALDYVLVGFLTVVTMLTTLTVVFWLPSYLGAVPVPVSAILGAGWVFYAVRVCYRLTGSMVAAFAPAIGWLVVSFWLSTSVTLGYGLVIGDWRAMLMLGLGALGAAVGLGVCWGSHVSRRHVNVVTPREAVRKD